MTADESDGAPLPRAIGAVCVTAGWVGAVLLAAMLGTICYDVVARYAFNAPTIWATEISTYLLVAVALTGIAYAHHVDAHIRMELLVTSLPPAPRRAVLLVAAWLGLGFAVFATWQACVMTWENHVNGTRIFSLLYTPISLPQIPVALGFAAFVAAMLGELHRLAPPPPGWRRAAGPLLLLAAALALAALGPRPPALPGFAVDAGSALLAAAVLGAAAAWHGLRLAGALAGVVAAVALVFGAVADAPVGLIVAAQVLVLAGLLALGVRVSLALGLLGLLGIYFLLPTAAPITIAERAWDTVNSFTLTAVPMFVLMGALLVRSGLSDQVFDALVAWLGRVPGGLAHAGVGACGLFAAVSGSSLATAATMGIVACPAMLDRGYSPRLALGCIAAGGTLGILIPPSIAMIVYGSTVGVSVATLFIAGIVPGLLLVLGFMAIVLVWALLSGAAAPRSGRHGWGERLASLRRILPIVLLVLAVLGTLYGGIATPTEAGAMGAAAALLLCLARGRLSPAVLAGVLLETVRVTAFLFLIIIGAAILTYTFDYMQLPQVLVKAAADADLPPALVMLAVAVVYVLLGMVIDTISMMVMTLPVLFPVVVAAGFDPVWFGVVLVILMEIGLITPPVGVNLFVLRGVDPRATMRDVVVGVLPFGAMLALAVVLLYWVPGLATWLPASMK